MSRYLQAPEIEVTDDYIAKAMEKDIREVVAPDCSLNMIVSNIGITPDLFRDLYLQRGDEYSFLSE